jgi:hypothetical protein
MDWIHLAQDGDNYYSVQGDKFCNENVNTYQLYCAQIYNLQFPLSGL